MCVDDIDMQAVWVCVFYFFVYDYIADDYYRAAVFCIFSYDFMFI